MLEDALQVGLLERVCPVLFDLGQDCGFVLCLLELFADDELHLFFLVTAEVGEIRLDLAQDRCHQLDREARLLLVHHHRILILFNRR